MSGNPTIRADPLGGKWQIIAPQRKERRGALLNQAIAAGLSSEPCPFCPGNERQTPPELFRVGTALEWSVRVVPNKYPAVDPPSAAEVQDRAANPPALGYHEVIIETPHHDESIESIPEARMKEVIRTYALRYRHRSDQTAVRYVSLFKNNGRFSGASIPHLHSQLLALCAVPPRPEQESRAFRKFAEQGRCPLCELQDTKSLGSDRVLAATRYYLVITPVASRFPYQLAIIPKEHLPDFAGLPDAALTELGALLQESRRTLRDSVGADSFNWSFQTAPLDVDGSPLPFHWYVEVVPRLANLGGFELSTDSYINIVSPEEAAAVLGPTFRESLQRR